LVVNAVKPGAWDGCVPESQTRGQPWGPRFDGRQTCKPGFANADRFGFPNFHSALQNLAVYTGMPENHMTLQETIVMSAGHPNKHRRPNFPDMESISDTESFKMV